MVGKTLRTYRIEAKLGAGGMGVVYRAVDSHLDRPVAIKVLPASALGSPERVGRFVQEAKAASSLNHPNIITIYDIDRTEVDGQPAHYIAMEYVPGQTLDRWIGRKGLRLRDALKTAVQIADGLAAAHASGIIHRDLKPSNVMVTEAGLVKILDFGLAKVAEERGADAFAATESAQAPLTEDGAIMGTVAYMSPEQAEGRKLDARSDIFTFGSVLYEMLAGRQAFSGGSKLSALSAILYKQPEALTELPPELERVLARCMRKEPERRWQSMADVKVALDELLEELDSGKTAPAPPQIRRRWFLPAVAGLLFGLVPGVYLARRWITREPPSYQRLTFRRGDVTFARFAPGGVVYSAGWDGAPPTLFFAQPGNREARELGLPPGNLMSITSGGEMAILLPSGMLVRAPLAGGAPREILEDVSGADWGPDGESLAVVRSAGGKHRLEYPVGKVWFESEARPPYSPRVSHDGGLVAFFEFDVEAGDYSLAVAGPRRPLEVLSRGWRAIGALAWSPDGSQIWFSAGRAAADPALYAVDLKGRLRVIAQAAGWLVMHDVARDGRVLLSAVNSRVGILSLPPGAAAERDLAWLDASLAYELSPDGKKLLFVELSYGEGRNSAIYLRDTGGAAAVRLGFGNRPSLSPDGKWVVCIRHDPGRSQLLLLPTGAGEPRTLSAEGLRYESAEWFPDSRRILFTASEAGRPARTWMRDAGGGPPKPVTPVGTRATRVSPDGNWVLVVSGGKLELAPVAGGEARVAGALEPAETPLRWTGDGRYIFLRRGARITRLEAATGRREPWRELKPPEAGANFIGPVALSADGLAYACSFQRDLGNLYLITGLE